MSDSKEVSTYVDKAMYPAEPMEEVYPHVTIVEATPDPLGSLAAMKGIYTGKVIKDKSQVTDDQRKQAWLDVQKTHLQAPLEFIDIHMFVEGVTRAWTHQAVRQRTAVYGQESLRFAVKENMTDACQLPPSLAMLPQNDVRVREWNSVLLDIQQSYDFLIANGIPAEDARGLLPHAVTTRMHFKTDLRNLMGHLGNRTCTQAQFEWRHFAASLRNAMLEHDSRPHAHYDNWQWRLIAGTIFKPICFTLGHCAFESVDDRGCTIRERMNSDRSEEVEETEYMLNPRAGWVA